MSDGGAAEAVVLEFFSSTGVSHEEDVKSFARYMTDDVVFNTGSILLNGLTEVLEYMDSTAVRRFDIASFKAEILNIATKGNVVMTERIDHLFRPDGTEALGIPVSGTLEVRDGKIAAWRDYYDTKAIAPFMPQNSAAQET